MQNHHPQRLDEVHHHAHQLNLGEKMKTPIQKDLMLYLDSIKDKNPGEITDQEIIKFIETVTDNMETFCSMIDYIDRWNRASNEFKVATTMHIAAFHKNETGDLLCKQYMDYYWMAADPKSDAGKLIAKLVETAEERYGKVH